MMRKLFVAVMVAGLVCLGGLARDARAGATIDLIFLSTTGAGTGAGTSLITAAAGDTLTMGIFLRNTDPITVLGFGIGYDTDSDNELDIGSYSGWAGVSTGGTKAVEFTQIVPPTTLNATLINEINSAVPPPPALPLPAFGGAFAGAEPNGYQLGTVTWVVQGGVNTDGVDITPGFNLQGIKGQVFSTTAGASIVTSVQFNSASVNLIPEPGTAALLGLGLVGIVVAGRRRSRP